MKPIALSIAKPNQGTINEDAVFASSSRIAVSDGAGGGGLYAEKWSAYLLEHLPDTPITSFKQLDEWIESIWEPFYNDCEILAKQSGGLLLDKFYDEGSFATLVAVWKESDNLCRWMSFGDSVAFHYNTETNILEYSFTSLLDFDKPPYLISCKDPLNEKGFRSGEFHTNEKSIVFCTSDALAFYIMLIYEISKYGEHHEDLEKLKHTNSKNTQHLKNAIAQKITFNSSIKKLFSCRSEINFQRHLCKLLKLGLISLDDYSIAQF